MNDETCKTCRWWKAIPAKSGPAHTLSHAQLHGPAGFGLCEANVFYENNDEGDRKNVVVYSYNESGAFYAGPDFGCIHHEALPKPDYVIEERYCDHCGGYTQQKFHDGGHERDSSGDRAVCLACSWRYSGMTGKWESPLGDFIPRAPAPDQSPPAT